MGFKAVAKHAPVYAQVKIYAAEESDQIFFVADRTYVVEAILESHSAGDAAGTVSVRKAPSGTAVGSGTALHSTAFDLGSTNNTPVIKRVGSDLVASQDTRTLVEGDALGLDFGGTLNVTYQGAFTVVLRPVPGSGDL